MKLRKQLDEIIKTDGGNNWWYTKLFQEKILPILPKELELLELPPSEDKNYNCFIYILGLSKNINIIKDTSGFIYDTFLQKLIDEKLIVYTKHP